MAVLPEEQLDELALGLDLSDSDDEREFRHRVYAAEASAELNRTRTGSGVTDRVAEIARVLVDVKRPRVEVGWSPQRHHAPVV